MAWRHLLHVLLFLAAGGAKAQPQVPPLAINRSACTSVSALFVFGDSTVDAGNNNFLATALKSNFPPYGRDFLGHLPTGRFTNGKLTTDFFASYLGIKEAVPPYLDWTLPPEELETGVTFASAGSGFDPLTAQISGVIPLRDQLDYFKDYLLKLNLLVGRWRSEDIIKRAVFMISAGTNDFVVNYFTIPIRQQKFSLEDYQAFLLKNVRTFIEELMKLGAKKIITVGLPPMGCLPIVITLNWKGGFHDRGCIETYNTIAKDYNQKLQKELEYLQSQSSGGEDISYADIYTPVLEMVTSPVEYGECIKSNSSIFQDTEEARRPERGGALVAGFTEAMNGCCGTGLVEAAVLCNLKSVVCEDASNYVFWDSIHPTEKTYFITFKSLRHIVDGIC